MSEAQRVTDIATLSRRHPAWRDLVQLGRELSGAWCSVLELLFEANAQALDSQYWKPDGSPDCWCTKQYLARKVKYTKDNQAARERCIQRVLNESPNGTPGSLVLACQLATERRAIAHTFKFAREQDGKEVNYRLRIFSKDARDKEVEVLKLHDHAVTTEAHFDGTAHRMVYRVVKVGDKVSIDGARLAAYHVPGYSVSIEVCGDWQPPSPEAFQSYAAHRGDCWERFRQGAVPTGRPAEDRPILHFVEALNEGSSDGLSGGRLSLASLKIRTFSCRLADYVATSLRRFQLLEQNGFSIRDSSVVDFSEKFGTGNHSGYLQAGMVNPLEILVNLVSVDQRLVLASRGQDHDGVMLSPVFGPIDAIRDAALGSGIPSAEMAVMRHGDRALGVSLHQHPVRWLGLVAATYAGKCVLIGEVIIPYEAAEILKKLQIACPQSRFGQFSAIALTEAEVLKTIRQVTPKTPSWQQRLAWALSLHRRFPSVVSIEEPFAANV